MSGEAAGAGPDGAGGAKAGGRVEQGATASGAGLEELIDTLRRRTDEGKLPWARWDGRGTYVCAVRGNGVVLSQGPDGLDSGEAGPEGADTWTRMTLLAGDGSEAGRFVAGPGRPPEGEEGSDLPAEAAEGLRRLYEVNCKPAVPAGDRVVDRMLRDLNS